MPASCISSSVNRADANIRLIETIVNASDSGRRISHKFFGRCFIPGPVNRTEVDGSGYTPLVGTCDQTPRRCSGLCPRSKLVQPPRRSRPGGFLLSLITVISDGLPALLQDQTYRRKSVVVPAGVSCQARGNFSLANCALLKVAAAEDRRLQEQ